MGRDGLVVSPAELLAAAEESIKAAGEPDSLRTRAVLLLVVRGAYNRQHLRLFGRCGPLGRVVNEQEDRRILCEFDARKVARWVEDRTAKGLIRRLCHACLADAPEPASTCSACGSTEVGWVVLRGSLAIGVRPEVKEGDGEGPCRSSEPAT